ncbi:MAG: hypothetical protein IT233_05335 [Bacteroidia bacterium]|nr:hypothetical protein [Bacteroidia bacterium]
MSFTATDTSASYRINSLLPLKEEYLQTDVHLVLLHANRIPPHLVLLVSGKVFTLTVRGGTVDSDVESLLRLIRRNRIETVFVRLNIPSVFTISVLREHIRKLIMSYPKVAVGIATCLDPIREFCGAVYDPSARDVNFVYELLPRLERSGVIKDSYHLFLDPYLRKGSYEIQKYSMNDIFEGIRKANEVL